MRGIIVVSLAIAVATVACSRRESAWQDASREDSVAAYEAYLARYPAGARAHDARAALGRLRDSGDWARAERLGTPEAWQGYLARWPEGRHAGLARRLLTDFIPPALPVQPATGAAAAYEIQLGAWLDEASAHAAHSHWQAKRASALDGVALRLVAPLATGPAMWRLRAGPLDEAAARASCASLKAAGTDCVPVPALSAGQEPR